MIVLSLQTEMQCNTKILEEVRKLNDKFTNLELQLLVTKNVNSLLQQRVIDLKDNVGQLSNIRGESA